jgi:hypothetical protein
MLENNHLENHLCFNQITWKPIDPYHADIGMEVNFKRKLFIYPPVIILGNNGDAQQQRMRSGHS